MNYIQYNPDEKIRIVFIYQVASFWPSWESLLNYCRHDSRFDVVILLLREHGIERQQMVTAEKFIKEIKVPYVDFDEFDLEQFKPHYAVYQTPYETDHRSGNLLSWSGALRRKGIRIVYIPYGIEIADTQSAMFAHFGTPVIINCFRIYTMSEMMKEEYAKHCSNYQAVRAFGLPKFDGIVQKEKFFFPQELKDRIQGRRIVLWKVHFPKIIVENNKLYQVSPDLDEYLKFINVIDQYSEMFFIFCPHPKFGDSDDYVTRVKTSKVLNLLSMKENVWIDRTDDYRNSLAAANAIMVDRSSLMVEAAVMGVPVMYIRNKDYEEPLTPPIKKLVGEYYQGTTSEDMIAFVEMFRSGKDPQKESREKMVHEIIPYADKRCGERIAEDLITALKTEDMDDDLTYDIKGKRVLIWGTGNISGKLYHILHFAEKHNLFHVIAYIDSDHKKENTIFQNKRIFAPDKIEKIEYDYVVIATEIYYNQVYAQLVGRNVAPDHIINFDRFLIEIMELKCEK